MNQATRPTASASAPRASRPTDVPPRRPTQGGKASDGRQGEIALKLARTRSATASRPALFLATLCLFLPVLLGMSTPLASAGTCPNQAVRGGASAALPDCRAYELITPADAAGRLLNTIEPQLAFNLFATALLSPSGASALFAIKGHSLSQPAGANGTSDLYEAQRTDGGWRISRLLSPSGEQAALPSPGGVSADHRYAFVEVPAGQPGEFPGTLGEAGTTAYLGKPDGSFEPLGVGSMGIERLVQGRFISEGGAHIVFTTGGEACTGGGECDVRQLEPNAPPTGTAAVYDRAANGPTRVVSLLPGEVTPAVGENAEYQGASSDGNLVAFKVEAVLYVRIGNVETEQVTSEPAVFAGILGGRIFYVNAGNIHQLRIASGEDTQVTATADAEVVNISADGTHIFFVSQTALPTTGAQAGRPNLYLWTETDQQTRFIATVSPSDLEGKPALNTWTSDAVSPEKTIGQGPGADPSRTTPDGDVFVFESRAQLTGYQNNGQVEIYRYDSVLDTLACISCNPSGAPATSSSRLEALEQFALQQGGESMLIESLSSSGARVFFETSESLLERDVDGVNDIYEWQADGTGNPQLSLISSGSSIFYSNPSVPVRFQEPNVMFAVTPSGSDVVFRTTDQLLPAAGAGGSSGLYDARIGGGFPEPVTPACGSQICEGPSANVLLSSPKSDAFQGRGNVPHRHARCRRRRTGSKGRRQPCRAHHKHRKGSVR